MDTQRHWHRVGSALAMAIALFCLSPTQVFAQNKNYTPGQKIEYKSSGYPEVWEEATFVRPTPDGSQPIINQKPSQYQPAGFQRATSWGDIRPLAAPQPPKPAEPPVPPPAVPVPPRHPPIIEPKRPVLQVPELNKPPPVDGRGLMSKAEVLAFLGQLGPNPFQHPRREQVKLALAELVKARGLDFRTSVTDRDFDASLAKYGATSDIVFPLRDNFGPPTRQAWLMGTWKLGKIGPAVYRQINNAVYRQGETAHDNVGSLTLNADGSYAWKSVTAQSTTGRWRAATHAEMKSQGGDGIVLLGAKSGYDWIVTQNRNTPLAGDWIGVSELGTRQINEFGSRR